MHDVVSLPFTLVSHGQLGAACVLFFFYMLILVCIAGALFEIANFAGVKTQTGSAQIITVAQSGHWRRPQSRRTI
ncbi:hypothetical protein WS75_22815 [Burkholderia sp. FL-7-2-10-S1-D7]|nr:hypothetical protein WS75_22815 [Burkholderia sp. FL-7-2-10-S1-D7]